MRSDYGAAWSLPRSPCPRRRGPAEPRPHRGRATRSAWPRPTRFPTPPRTRPLRRPHRGVPGVRHGAGDQGRQAVRSRQGTCPHGAGDSEDRLPHGTPAVQQDAVEVEENGRRETTHCWKHPVATRPPGYQTSKEDLSRDVDAQVGSNRSTSEPTPGRRAGRDRARCRSSHDGPHGPPARIRPAEPPAVRRRRGASQVMSDRPCPSHAPHAVSELTG